MRRQQLNEMLPTQPDMFVFLQNNRFMGFVEPLGAHTIICDAQKAGHVVELDRDEGWFNVILEGWT